MERKKSSLSESIQIASDSVVTFSTEVFDFFPNGIVVLEEITYEDGDLDYLFKYQNKVAEEYNKFQIDKNESLTFRNCSSVLPKTLFNKLTDVSKVGETLKEVISVNNQNQEVLFEITASKIPSGLIVSILEVSEMKRTPKSERNGKESIEQQYPDGLDDNSYTDIDVQLQTYSSELRMAEAKIKELEQANQILKKDFKEQFEELSNKNSLLLKVNNDLDNFVYTASHDLKSPISNIEGLINALISELPEGNSEVKHIIGLLSLSLNKFQSLIHDLSEIAHVQKDDEENQLIKLLDLFQDVKFSLHEVILKYGAVVEGDFSQVSEIYFSRKNITSLITNLISNSLKYSSPTRMPEIFVQTSQVNDFFVISVKDNGLGIKPEDKEKIFSVFKRIYTHVSGSGVGLFIVKRIVDNNGGKIEIESEINKGTTFKIFLKNAITSG